TINLYRRWQNHHKLNEILAVDPQASLHFVSVNTNDSELLLEIERNFIEQLQPELNTQGGVSNLLPNKSIRYELEVYDFLKKKSEVDGINVDKLVRKILRNWMESELNPELKVEVSSSDIMKSQAEIKYELKKLRQTLTSDPLTSTPKPAKKERPPKIDFNTEQADAELKDFFAQLNEPLDSKKDTSADNITLPSKIYKFDQFLLLSQEDQTLMANFFIDFNLIKEFGEMGKTGSMILEGEVLSKFEKQFGVIE
ncbi:MAG: hypothetical protein MUF43_06715, partial [Flavobacterium sp.]|nr:hypothetical protein [Flavobacterium sp.]